MLPVDGFVAGGTYVPDMCLPHAVMPLSPRTAHSPLLSTPVGDRTAPLAFALDSTAAAAAHPLSTLVSDISSVDTQVAQDANSWDGYSCQQQQQQQQQQAEQDQSEMFDCSLLHCEPAASHSHFTAAHSAAMQTAPPLLRDPFERRQHLQDERMAQSDGSPHEWMLHNLLDGYTTPPDMP